MADCVKPTNSTKLGLSPLPPLSNLLWIFLAWYAQAYALIWLQVGVFLLNLRGLEKTHCNGA
jgi:hypothetical protein